MTSTLRPVTAVRCPSTGLLVAVEECEGCPNSLEVRIPWSHFAVKCDVGDESEGAYP